MHLHVLFHVNNPIRKVILSPHYTEKTPQKSWEVTYSVNRPTVTIRGRMESNSQPCCSPEALSRKNFSFLFSDAQGIGYWQKACIWVWVAPMASSTTCAFHFVCFPFTPHLFLVFFFFLFSVHWGFLSWMCPSKCPFTSVSPFAELESKQGQLKSLLPNPLPPRPTISKTQTEGQGQALAGEDGRCSMLNRGCVR